MTSGGLDVSISMVPESQEVEMDTQSQQQQQQQTPMTHPMDALRAMSISSGRTGASSSMMMPPTPVRRGVERNKSGSGMSSGRVMRGGRAPPKRSQSHKIGRPAFDPSAPAEPVRGVNRSHSNRVKGPPGRAGSFNRRAPGRASSTSSLRGAQRRGQPLAGGDAGGADDISVSDSVFTSASNQTLDSIMLRKKQIDHDHEGNVIPSEREGNGPMRGSRPNNGRVVSEIEFDESLHTVDSMHLPRNRTPRGQVEEYYDDQDMSIFSESFGSTGSDYEYLSEYDEDEDEEAMDGPIREDEETTISKSNEGGADESME